MCNQLQHFLCCERDYGAPYAASLADAALRNNRTAIRRLYDWYLMLGMDAHIQELDAALDAQRQFEDYRNAQFRYRLIVNG